MPGYFALRIRKDWHFRRAVETGAAMRWLRTKTRPRILDIGCGEGTYDYRLVRRGARVVGFDIHKERLRQAARHHLGRDLLFVEARAEAIPVRSGSFDYVMSLCVFEHLANDGQVLAEARRALRPGGRLVLTLDSLSRPDVPESWRDHHRKTHAVRTFYTVPAIESRLKRHGFRLIRSRYLLASPLDFHLIRLSYATERMKPVRAALVRTLLVTAGRLISHLANAGRSADNGWTLVVEASAASRG